MINLESFHHVQKIFNPPLNILIFGSGQQHMVIHLQGKHRSILLCFFVSKVIIFRIIDISCTTENVGIGTETDHILQELLLNILLHTGYALIDGFCIGIPAFKEYSAIF